MPRFSNNITRAGEGVFHLIEDLIIATGQSQFSDYEEYREHPSPDVAKSTPEENYRLRIETQKPTQKVQIATKDFANRLEIRFADQYEIAKNSGGNHKARKAAMEIFGGIVGGIIPAKLGTSGIELDLGDGVKQAASTISDYLDDVELQDAQNIVSLFAGEDEAMRILREDIITPFATRIMRNYEDQIEALSQDSVDKFMNKAVERIFYVLSHSSNPEFAMANSRSNPPIERLNYALLYRVGSHDTLMTKDGEKWNMESMLTKPRIKIVCKDDESKDVVRIDEAIFAHPDLDRNDGKYAERWGTAKEAINLGYVKFDNRRQADNVLTSKCLESFDYKKQKIGNQRASVIEKQNKTILQQSLEISDDVNLSLYCKSLRDNLTKEFVTHPQDYRNLNLVSDELVHSLTLANARQITKANAQSVMSYSKSDADSIVTYTRYHPTHSISQIVSEVRTSPADHVASNGFSSLKNLVDKVGEYTSFR